MRRLLASLLLLSLAACTPGEPFAAFRQRTDLVQTAEQAATQLSRQLHEQGRAADPIRLDQLGTVGADAQSPLSELLLQQVAAGLARRGHTIDSTAALTLPELLFQGPQRPRELTLRGPVSRLDLGGSYAVARERVFVSMRVSDGAEGRLVAAHDFEIRQDGDVRALLVDPVQPGYRRDLAGNYYLPR